MTSRIGPALLAISSLIAVPSVPGAVDFAREVKPLLEKACVQCHGPEKQKGGLRLDTREALMKGGDEGPAVSEGKPAESELYRRTALPPDDEDVMPPKGKAEHLTPAELDLLKRWIAEGAPWPAGIVAVAVKAEVAGGVGPEPTAAELSARAELAKIGLRVRPVATGLNWTTVSFRKLGRDVPPEALAHLREMKTLIELDLGGTSVTDDAVAHLAGLTNLNTLNLSGTAITDAALEHLTALTKLTTLNLFGTQVSDAGLAKLPALKQLARIYAAETKVTPAGVATLHQAFPQARVELGSQFAELARKPPEPKKPDAATGK